MKGIEKYVRKVSRVGLFFLVVLTTVSLKPIYAEEEYHVIVTLQAPEPTSFGGYGYETAFFEDGIVIGEWTGDILQAPAIIEKENFGREIDVVGDVIVVGCSRSNIDDIHEAGRGYLFDSEGTTLAVLQSPDPGNFGWYGAEVALGLDCILVAELGGSEQGFYYPGCVYVYDYEGALIRNVTSPMMKSEGFFGRSLAASDEYILVGETGRSDPIDMCSVYVYDYDWHLVTILQSPDQQEHSFFGFSTSISGDYVVIGEHWASVDGHEKAGRAHIYDTGWNYVASLQSPTPEDNAEFGLDVVTGGDIVVVGERRGDVESMNEGKAYVYDLEGNLVSTLISPAPFPGNQFGYSVETDGEIIVVCEADVEAGGESKAGKVHVFSLGEPAAEQPAPEEETTEAESEPESESEKSGGIPGFPLESIVISIALTVILLWFMQRKR